MALFVSLSYLRWSSKGLSDPGGWGLGKGPSIFLKKNSPTLLWLWRRPAATAWIRLLAWKSPYATGATIEKTDKGKKKTKNKKPLYQPPKMEPTKTETPLHTYEMAKIPNTDSTKCWWGATGNLIRCWWECKMVQLLCKMFGQFPTRRASNCTCWYDTKLKMYVHTQTCTRMFTVALFINSQTWKKPRYPSVNEWTLRKYPDDRRLFSTKKKWAVKPWKKHGWSLSTYC